jgi:hypothetical protein
MPFAIPKRAALMSALGHKRTFLRSVAMSAIPPKADIDGRSPDVRFVPEADIHAAAISPLRNARSHTIYQHLRGNHCQVLPHAPFETRPLAPSP